MADAKWIPDLHGDTPVAAAAGRILSLRLEAVRQRLPLAAQLGADVEEVHQLRVGTRRAAAALRLFRDLLPDRLQRRTRKVLRRLRRAAGGARDWDVFLESLSQRLARTSGKPQHGLDLLVGLAHAERARAQDELVDTARRRGAALNEVIQEAAEVLADCTAQEKLHERAVPALTQLLHDLETAAEGDLSVYEALHQVRILGKRLRYAMEVFESCFAAPFRDEYYAAVVDMQDILGHANDSRVAAERLRKLRDQIMRVQPQQWARYEPGIDALLRYHERRLPQQRRAFVKWWRAWKNSGAEHAFAELIEEPSSIDKRG
jgi:CHAD domain-containing protein